jgi:phytoene synthase
MAYSVCKGITRAAAKNFYYAFLVLPRRKREALCSVYAFMRRCDDIADDATLSLAERSQKLNAWLDALHNAQQGNPTDDAILLALTDAQRRFLIPIGLLDELAMGTAMDVEAAGLAQSAGDIGLTVEYKTFEELRVYCYRVASVVGLVCIHVFGYRDPAAEVLAEHCGLAFQLTNIIRDVKEDASMGRVYLPQEDLARFGLSNSELLAGPDPARFREILAFEAARAREFYGAGDALIPYVSEDSQPALWVLITIYRRLLGKIAEKQYDVFTARVSLSSWEKSRVLLKGILKRIT